MALGIEPVWRFWIDRNEINFGVALDTFDLYISFSSCLHWSIGWGAEFTECTLVYKNCGIMRRAGLGDFDVTSYILKWHMHSLHITTLKLVLAFNRHVF